jgi:peptide chain release factor 2
MLKQERTPMKVEDLIVETVKPEQLGGQRAGVVSTEVRVTHVPTGISATCGAERGQFRNRAICYAMLEYGLAELGWKGLKSHEQQD